MNNVITAERDQMMLMPPNIRDWLPQGHLAVFIADIIDRLDISHIEEQYKGSGKRAYSPALLLSLLFYGYATGVFSSRQIERGTYDSVAFRFLSGDTHPDHDTISSFRKRFLEDLKPLFVQILLIAREMKCLKVGTIAIDGTKIKANAGKHKAMSWGYAVRLENQLKKEINQLLRKAEKADNAEDDSEFDIPKEIRIREKRLSKIEEAKKVLEQRAKDRHTQAVSKWEERKKARSEKTKKTGTKPKGKRPQQPKYTGPENKDQYNFTDPESRIMKSHGSFEQCQNAQIGVDVESLLVIGTGMTNSPNDKQRLLPTLDSVEENTEKPGSVLADSGYFSEANIDGCEKRNIDAYVPPKRDKHNIPLQQRNRKRAPSNMSEPAKEMWKRIKSDFGNLACEE